MSNRHSFNHLWNDGIWWELHVVSASILESKSSYKTAEKHCSNNTPHNNQEAIKRCQTAGNHGRHLVARARDVFLVVNPIDLDVIVFHLPRAPDDSNYW